jgi:hypothetical protein
MGTLVSLLIGGATFGLGVATGLALATSGALMCGAVGQCRRRGKEPEETEPAKRRA